MWNYVVLYYMFIILYSIILYCNILVSIILKFITLSYIFFMYACRQLVTLSFSLWASHGSGANGFGAQWTFSGMAHGMRLQAQHIGDVMFIVPEMEDRTLQHVAYEGRVAGELWTWTLLLQPQTMNHDSGTLRISH